MISTVLLFLTVMSFSPEFVIRLNLLLRLHPIQSLTVSIEDRGYDYSYQCYMYRVSGYDPYEWFVPDEFKGSAGDFWYVKKTKIGLYYVYRGAYHP
ncbi:hypothetical protein [Calidifontibacillus erzurumensis]|uniref:Uncharacterized protein n=1 Tax=Calidifontibacillus erzurumensis TaxID=2741433 RepID=A0A8J8GEE4_9BACI|nr:hypothetical protein [Calidifontibacillus erzurumensis]NSL52339.1 hypothetical protein [Calidifontibacillus erzurumensis]